MKKSRVLVLGIAFVAAAGAALLARSIVGEQKTQQVITKEFMNTTEVLVASQKIKIGEMVSASQFKWQQWPKDGLTSTMIDRASNQNALKGLDKAIARGSFLPGEPIQEGKLIKANQGGVMAAILTPGMRAVSTKIKEETAAGGFILPNDRVDVILSRKLGRSSQSKFTSSTILSNVKVLAIGQTIEQSKGEKSASGKTATLELTLAQAEVLALADQMGSISLALRSISLSNPGGKKEQIENLREQRGNSVRIIKFGRSVQSFDVR